MQRIEQAIKQKNQLDILARLLTGKYNNKNKKDTCVAICNHENKLFIASNKKKPDYAKECLKDLQQVIKNNSVKSYENLLRKSVEKIRYTELKTTSPSITLKEFKQKAKECSERENPD